jgi:hypothetical protein
MLTHPTPVTMIERAFRSEYPAGFKLECMPGLDHINSPFKPLDLLRKLSAARIPLAIWGLFALDFIVGESSRPVSPTPED